MPGHVMTQFLLRILLKIALKQNFCITAAQNKKIMFIIFANVLITVITPSFATIKYQSNAHAQNDKHKNKAEISNSSTAYVAQLQTKALKQFAKKSSSIPTAFANGIHNEHATLKLVTSIEQRVVNFIHRMIATLNYSSYKLGGTRFDLMNGIYILDCSSYVDFILKTIYPHAFSNLVNYSSSQKPTTHDYYHFFMNMIDEPQDYWSVIEDVEQLRPGDILVFRYRNTRRERAGHVMIVMDAPIRHKDTYLVRIADSAPHRHSRDTRQATDTGIGIGTLLIKVDPKTFQPSAYAWQIGSRWRRNVNFAMARPIHVQL